MKISLWTAFLCGIGTGITMPIAVLFMLDGHAIDGVLVASLTVFCAWVSRSYINRTALVSDT